jgi:hypothetical protein
MLSDTNITASDTNCPASSGLVAVCTPSTSHRTPKISALSTRYTACTRIQSRRKRQRVSPISSPCSDRNCYVAVSDVLNPPALSISSLKDSISRMQAELLETKAKLAALESSIVPLLPLTTILTCTSTENAGCLLSAAKLIDTLASEISQRIHCNRQVLVYNVPDKFPAEKAKLTILQICGLENESCRCTRLRKSSPTACCPILLEFSGEQAPTVLLKHQTLLSCHPYLKTARIMPARTRMQREIFKASRGTSIDKVSNVLPDPKSLSAILVASSKICATPTTAPVTVTHTASECSNHSLNTSISIDNNGHSHPVPAIVVADDTAASSPHPDAAMGSASLSTLPKSNDLQGKRQAYAGKTSAHIPSIGTLAHATYSHGQPKTDSFSSFARNSRSTSDYTTQVNNNSNEHQLNGPSSAHTSQGSISIPCTAHGKDDGQSRLHSYGVKTSLSTLLKSPLKRPTLNHRTAPSSLPSAHIPYAQLRNGKCDRKSSLNPFLGYGLYHRVAPTHPPDLTRPPPLTLQTPLTHPPPLTYPPPLIYQPITSTPPPLMSLATTPPALSLPCSNQWNNHQWPFLPQTSPHSPLTALALTNFLIPVISHALNSLHLHPITHQLN